MYCPKCGADFVPGVTQCGECNVALVDEPPPRLEPQYQELITVFESLDPNLLPIAESLLQAAGIPYFMQNDSSGTLLGAVGPIPLGPPTIQVVPEYENEARSLLSDLSSSSTGLEPQYEELSKVIESLDPNLLSIAESLLQAEGIPYFVQNDSSGGLLGALPPIPRTIQVVPAYVDEARSLLSDLSSSSAGPDVPGEGAVLGCCNSRAGTDVPRTDNR